MKITNTLKIVDIDKNDVSIECKKILDRTCVEYFNSMEEPKLYSLDGMSIDKYSLICRKELKDLAKLVDDNKGSYFRII